LHATLDDDTHTEAEHALPPIMLALSSARPTRTPTLRPASPKLTPATVIDVCPLAGPLLDPPTLEIVAVSYENSVDKEPLCRSHDDIKLEFGGIPAAYFVANDDSDTQTDHSPVENPAVALGVKSLCPNPAPSIVILREPLVAKFVVALALIEITFGTSLWGTSLCCVR
jgi:hypothetical protein